MNQPDPSKPRSWTRFIPLGLIVCLLVAAVASGTWKHLSLRELADHHQQLQTLVAQHPVLTLAAFLGLYVLVVVACIPGPGAMNVAGGLLFGVWLGGAVCLFSCLIGAIIVFLACRTAFGDWAAHRAGATVAKIEAGFSNNAFSYLLALRLMPVAPFSMVTIAAGLARVRLSVLIIATLIGAAPSAFIFAGLGAGLGEVFQRGAKVDASLMERPMIIGPLAALAAMSLAPILWRMWRGRKAPAA